MLLSFLICFSSRSGHHNSQFYRPSILRKVENTKTAIIKIILYRMMDSSSWLHLFPSLLLSFSSFTLCSISHSSLKFQRFFENTLSFVSFYWCFSKGIYNSSHFSYWMNFSSIFLLHLYTKQSILRSH